MSSEKFKQVSIPCKDCLVTAACQDKQSFNADKLFNFMLVMESWDESKKVYRKGLIECWANQGWDLFSHMRSSEFNGLPKEITPEFIDFFIEIASLLQWIVNSTSWQNGEKFDFDVTEIKRKLEKAMTWI